MLKTTSNRTKKIGTVPGSVVFTGKRKVEEILIHYLEYNETTLIEKKYKNQSIKSFFSPNEQVIQWYDVRGLHDIELIEELGRVFAIHTLVLEDVVDVSQRPKYEEYENGILCTLHALNHSNESINKESVSIYFGNGYVISFQEGESDLFENVRNRITANKGRINSRGADYLCYALIDCIVDQYFLVLDNYSEDIDHLEQKISNDADESIKGHVLSLKQQGLRMKKSIYPLREAISKYSRSDHPLLSKKTHVFIRDIYENTIQIMDAVETSRDVLNGLQDLYMTEISFRMNKVMQVLTVVTTIFVPLSFLAGIYGMNFEYIPELKFKFGYFTLWGVMITCVITLLFVFSRKKWL